MSRLLCCLRRRRRDAMGAALSHTQEGDGCDVAAPVAPPTMADVIRERKKKAGGAGLGTLRRRIANAARRPRDNRPDRGCEHARFIRSVVSSWKLAEVFVLCEELEAGAAIRDLTTQADLAREPAPALHAQLAASRAERSWCDVELCGAGSWSVCAHRCILAARSAYFRDLLQRYPPSCLRVPLEGACANMSRAECEACVCALYAGTQPRVRATHHAHSHKYDNEMAEADLDIINVDSNPGRDACTCGDSVSARTAAALGVSRDPLHTSMHYLLDSGEMSDTRLVFRLEGGGAGAAYGFRTALELPCHRAVLAARSRYFKSVMSRRGGGAGGGGGAGAVCVDEKVLPRRFARALLHAAYTDQVDLSLIGRNTSSPPSTGSTSSASAAASAAGCGPRGCGAGQLDDAFQLYEIARFLEMPIVVQGCEDAIVEALSPETLAHVVCWAAQPHASHWVHRQAMRYLRDEFPVIMSHAAAARLPRSALAAALASDHLQASETQALRALVKWSADQPPQREPNVVWHTAHSVSRRGARRRSGSDAALRETLAALVPFVRTEHLPHDTDLLNQLVRRGIVPPPPAALLDEVSTAHAWLGRGSYRPARCFLPYLDEIKALLEDQTVSEAELARARRARYLHRIPDTLYMVAAERSAAADACALGPAADADAWAWLSARTAAALRARARELRAAPPAHHALAHAQHAAHTRTQTALRAVREMGLPDACAEMLLKDDHDDNSSVTSSEWEAGADRGARESSGERYARGAARCCRSESGGARSGELGAREGRSSSGGAPRPDSTHHRRAATGAAGGAAAGGAAGGARLSAAVPDVAMAPNANTHLLTHRDYFRHPPPWEYGGAGGAGGAGAEGAVLQLDLGDGATHTPRPGSRAQRNTAGGAGGAGGLLARAADHELRAAIEMSVLRAYSSYQARGGAGSPPAPRRSLPPATLPLPLPLPQYREAVLPQPHLPPGGAGSAGGASGAGAPPLAAGVSPSPRRRREYSLRPHLDYRVEGGYGGSASTSRGPSPNSYA